MCGICGIVNKCNKEVDSGVIANMIEAMVHRGPDDKGMCIRPHIGLGHCRLSIQDLSPLGRQPMSNEDGTVWIAFNGEIYNFIDLRTTLSKKNHRFKSKSDTEVILHLFEEYGLKSFEFLNGMFAFAVLDLKSSILTLVRDRIGVKPLYYYDDNERFAFASELKALLCVPGIQKNVKRASLNDYFCFGMVPGPDTIYECIYKLEPGHYLQLSLDSGKLSPQIPYWHLEFSPDYKRTEDEWIDMILSLLTDAVKKRLISDVPLGVFLSGGIDSSIITAIASKLTGSPVKTFSIGFHEEDYNELPVARKVAEKYHTEHHEAVLDIDALSVLPKLVKQCDEPFADSSIIPTYYVCNLAKRFATVVLSGDGGDESFAGYKHYYKAYTARYFNPLSVMPLYLLFKEIQIKWPYMNQYFRHITRLSLRYRWERNFSYIYFLYDPLNYLCLEPSWREDPESRISSRYKNIIPVIKDKDFLTQMQYFDFRITLPNDYLVKVDRASMINSLEIRNPFLDYRLVELAAKIPSSIKMKNGNLKYLLKRIALQLLPAEVVNQPKKGFAIPLSSWFQGNFIAHVKDTFADGISVKKGFLNPEKITHLIKLQENPKCPNMSFFLWKLLVFEYWCREYL